MATQHFTVSLYSTVNEVSLISMEFIPYLGSMHGPAATIGLFCRTAEPTPFDK